MKNNKSLKQVKKLLTGTQRDIEKRLRKNLTRYDNIKDEKERKKAKETFLVAYQSVFNDSISAVIKELLYNKRLADKIRESGKSYKEIITAVGIVTEFPAEWMDHFIQYEGSGIENRKEKEKSIAKALGCKVEDIFD